MYLNLQFKYDFRDVVINYRGIKYDIKLVVSKVVMRERKPTFGIYSGNYVEIFFAAVSVRG